MKVFDINQKVSQAESQKIDYIILVLDYFLSNGNASETKLKKKLKLSKKSVEGTINLLLNKGQLIKLKKIVQHGEKIYSIKSKKALRKYKEILLRWQSMKKTQTNLEHLQKVSKPIFDFGTKLKKQQRRNAMRVHSLPHGMFTTLLHIESKQKQKGLSNIPWPQPITIDQMRYKKAIKIINDYIIGKVCHQCFKENQLSYTILDEPNKQQICQHCGYYEIIQETPKPFFKDANEPLDPKKKLRQSFKQIIRQSRETKSSKKYFIS